jgi:copper(I)-binding protein
MRARFILAFLLGLLVAPANAADTTHNGITIICPWAEATRNGITIAPVYMEIRASPQSGDRLESAAFFLADQVELDTYARVAGVLRREPIPYIAVEAGQSVQLQPGGFHLLLVGLKQPLVANTTFEMWVQFANAGGFEIEVDVVPIGAGPPCGRPAGAAPPPAGAPPRVGAPPVFVPVPRGSF